ncbi:MAG: hypothetical protein K0S45_3430 [Nitrospira sp.]|jgi:hypothetical protein|nr:hypothetical protein [Nitrospira sp.]
MALSKKVLDLTLRKIIFRIDPSHVFYRVAVDETIKGGELAEIQSLIKGARGVKAKYGDIDGLIKALETAAEKVR